MQEGLGQDHPLGLASRQFAATVVPQVRQPHGFQASVGALASLVCIAQPVGGGVEVEELPHLEITGNRSQVGHVAHESTGSAGVFGDVDTVEEDIAVGGFHERG